MSILNYFQSKAISKKQIEDEEKSRFNWMDQTCLFLKIPKDFHRIKHLVTETKNLFPDCKFVNSEGSIIKVFFAESDQKNEAAAVRKVWPHNHEPVEFLDPVSFNLDSKLKRERVMKELVVNNFFFLERSHSSLEEDLWSLFPQLHHYEVSKRRNRITLIFKEPIDAIEAFMLSKQIQICGLNLTTTFNR